MSDESKIPILHDLLFKGNVKIEKEEPVQSLDENTDFEIEQDEFEPDEYNGQNFSHEDTNEAEDDIEQEKEPTVQELIIDEEIRIILNKHMDKAYAEIIRLLNLKIS